ncbi:sensor histidine kinase [Reichenbachiella ulvae]|uniref:Histidine kinase n=1 Tax=Reichenbachiella ulvae TaxID=2980104 RepID=A0ABT3CPK3_9BACT|nr:histidine kinase [Reichenbachiella ulvae]MCV9385574.1 histidine kinase [Reichenbachiella ulvae]
MSENEAVCVSPQQKWRKLVWTAGIVPLLGSIVISYFFCPTCVEQGRYSEFAISTVISYMYWIALSFGNSFLVDRLERYYTWLEKPVTRTILSILLMSIYTVLVAFVMNFLIVEYLIGKDFWESLEGGHLKGSITNTVIIALFISLFFHARGFFISWREMAVQNERLNTENANSKLETLKSQVNPHFLFNSLNALTSLVYDDQQKAVEFIQKLSAVYRYVIHQQGNELVTVEEELDFVKAFVYLNQIRFGKNFGVEITGEENMMEESSLPPLALQMLIENCIKHNEISKACPLHIMILIGSDHIIVKNNINPIQQEKPDSTGLGLKNIKSRYSHLTKTEVEVRKEENEFAVKLPIIKLKKS